MENSRPEEEKIIQDTRNLFRLEKETKAIKDIKNLKILEILRIFLSINKKKIFINL